MGRADRRGVLGPIGLSGCGLGLGHLASARLD
jgi:hypothetical protein